MLCFIWLYWKAFHNLYVMHDISFSPLILNQFFIYMVCRNVWLCAEPIILHFTHECERQFTARILDSEKLKITSFIIINTLSWILSDETVFWVWQFVHTPLSMNSLHTSLYIRVIEELVNVNWTSVKKFYFYENTLWMTRKMKR